MQVRKRCFAESSGTCLYKYLATKGFDCKWRRRRTLNNH
ncbi:hypothetical protein B4119_0935 [Parageobacillus caldoxylosilyticus]|uniref:Uncharacterized protein n=1 Tax=Saccharococcus caldoxylosilyticus TaxID=81408 RepID=A0A150LLU8_9BACL|nr:hypothetical protein B4119_0935 [Parageobacillus caldoxylosilyticus]